MVGKPGPFSCFLAVSSGLLVAVSALIMIAQDVLPGLFISLIFFVIWILFVRFLAFMSETGELDVSPMLEEIEEDRRLEELREMINPGQSRENQAQNPERIIGASNRTLVASTTGPKRGRQTQRNEPNTEAEDDRAWAEMMRVL